MTTVPPHLCAEFTALIRQLLLLILFLTSQLVMEIICVIKKEKRYEQNK